MLVLYELGAMMIAGRAGGMRNGADVLLRTLLSAGGLTGTLAFTAVLAVGAAVIVGLEQKRKRVPIRPAYFGGMLAEKRNARIASRKLGNMASRQINAQHCRTPGTSQPSTYYFKA